MHRIGSYIRLGWRRLRVNNTLAYHGALEIEKNLLHPLKRRELTIQQLKKYHLSKIGGQKLDLTHPLRHAHSSSPVFGPCYKTFLSFAAGKIS